ncbi:MAG: glutathione S-transferase family protein [Kangiellaceae bacterium]|nr:glutathione S-transferase family protein [Kangiellaceae bacterium]
MSLTTSKNCNLILYTNPQSRGQIARWMLEETGADYQQEIIEYGDAMKSDDFLKINLMGKVPVITNEGKSITECAAICAYLADAFPEANLAPPQTDRADYYRWLFFAAGPLEAAITNRSLKIEISDEQQRMVGYGCYDKVLDVLSKAVTMHQYIAGDHFTAADVYVGSHINWGMMFGTIEKRPEFEAYAAKLTKRPAYKAASAIDVGLMN